MSYYDQSGRYGQQQGGYQNQYNQYQAQDGYATQGLGHGAPEYPAHQQYGQPQYGYDQPGGGPVQQPYGQETYGSPSASAYTNQQYTPTYQQPHQTYNPQAYAQENQQSYAAQQYNPPAYPSAQHGAATPGTYNPADYAHTLSGTNAGPLDPYGCSPAQGLGTQQGYAPVARSGYGQVSQHAQHQWSSAPPQHPQYAHQSPAQPQQQPNYSYAQSMSSPTSSARYAMPDPQHYTSYSAQRTDASRRDDTHVPLHTSASVSPPPGAADYSTRRSSSQHYRHGSGNPPRQSPSPLLSPDSQDYLPSPPEYSSTPGPTPPIHRSDTIGRHPQGRPLPGAPAADWQSDYFASGRRATGHDEEMLNQEELFQSVEDAVLGRSPSISVSRAPAEDASGEALTLFPTHSPRGSNGNVVNGHLSPIAQHESDPYSSDSDPEAAAGIAAMRMEDERDAAEEARRQSGSTFTHHRAFSTGYGSLHSRQSSRHEVMPLPPPPSDPHNGGDSDGYAGVDVSMLSGSFDPGMSYGGDDPHALIVNHSQTGRPANGVQYSLSQSSREISSQHSSMRGSHRSQSSQNGYEYDSIHPFPAFQPAAARVDAGGVGGLAEPGRRQSYDEGDDDRIDQMGALPDRFPDEPPDIPFHPASRPLPPPPGPMEDNSDYVPRSTSMIDRSSRESVPQPLRSKTDAEERRLKTLSSSGFRTSQIYDLRAFDSKLMDSKSLESSYGSTPASASAVALDLPSLPTKRFAPSKLGASDFDRCSEPWSLKGIFAWLREITSEDKTTELKEGAIKDALVALFTNKVPTMNIADAEVLSSRVVEDMYAAGTLVPTEEWVKLVPGPMNGVLFQLTGSGCYAPALHDHITPGRCYSPRCQRTVRKANLKLTTGSKSEFWHDFYNLKKEDLEGKDKKLIEIQNILHEIVYSEERYMEQLNVLRTLYRDPLKSSDVLSPKRREKFLGDVFGRVEPVKVANEEHLLPQLKYRQQEQGPWITGFSDIFRQWIRKAKSAYIDYAGAFPGASFVMRQEIERNITFQQFIDHARADPRGQRLGWDTFLKAPITRLQRYSLLLGTVLRSMKTDSAEKTNLIKALEEIKTVTLECDGRVAEMQRKVDLADLQGKLVLRPGMQTAVELNLNHLGRELAHRGDLQRMGGNRFTWLDCHAILFDHYLVLAKTVSQRADQGGKFEKYDVSRLPIPMDLLILESAYEPAVQKSSYVKGIASVATVASTGRNTSTPDSAALGRTSSGQSSSVVPLQHTNTSNSLLSTHTITNLDTGKDSEKIMYPFKVKHLGRETYTLFAPTESARRDWVTKIIEAKTKHARSLFAQHAEPFRLNVMADSAFVYDGFANPSSRTTVIEGTPVDRAIKEVEERFKEAGRPGPICRARVNCATTYTGSDNKLMCAVGTDYGVFVAEMGNPRGWSRVITMNRVTQVAVLEEFNLFLLIADKSLIAYNLDVVSSLDRNGGSSSNDSARKAPQKLSGSRDVGFFVTGRMKDRTLVFYKKRENLSSTFKVLEPIFQKSAEKKRSVFKRGNTDFFREYDEFYIPAECSGINLFHSSLAVSTARGFEVLTLDKKQPWSVPDLRATHVQNIAAVVERQKALSMLRLSEQEFLLCYQNCAVYVNKHGDVSRSVIMEFVGNAQSAALYGAYLILFDNDFVEIRNAQNGRLKQIIAGREIKCLDDGVSAVSAASSINENGTANGMPYGGLADQRTVKLVMQHPEMEKTQIVAELLLNDGMKD